MDLQKARVKTKAAACRVAVAGSQDFRPQMPKALAGTSPSIEVNSGVSLSRFRVSWETRNQEHL